MQLFSAVVGTLIGHLDVPQGTWTKKLQLEVVNRAVGSIGQEQVAISGISTLSIQTRVKTM